MQSPLTGAMKGVHSTCMETVKFLPIGACDHGIVDVGHSAVNCDHMQFSNPIVAHPSFAKKALMVVCQALAAEGIP